MIYRELIFFKTWDISSWLNLKLESGEISMSDNISLLFFKAGQCFPIAMMAEGMRENLQVFFKVEK